MLYYQHYKFIQHIFSRILGLSPWTHNKKEICELSSVGTCYNISISLIIILLGVYEVLDETFADKFPGKLVPLIIVKVIFITLLCTSFIPLVYIIKQKQLIRVMNRFKDVDRVLSKCKNYERKYDHTNIIIFCTNFLTTIFLILILDACYFSIVRIFIENLPTIIGGGVMIQYAMIVNKLNNRFDIINTIFSKLGNLKVDATPQVFTVTQVASRRLVITDIDNLKYAFVELCEMCQYTADFYGMSVLISILCYAERIIFCVYLSLLPALELGNFETLWQVTAPRLIWIVFVFLMFTASITTIKKQVYRSLTDDKIVEKVIFFILLLMLLINKIDFSSLQLSQFSIDLLHLKVEFTAYDIMPLDRTLLAIITGTITMYLIIAIQFADSPS
ncbi:GSCOCT00014049001.2-RA-CDS, partial [Cotesia congregata]